MAIVDLVESSSGCLPFGLQKLSRTWLTECAHAAELRDLEAQVDAYKQSKAAAASKDPLGAEKVSTGLLGTIQGLFR